MFLNCCIAFSSRYTFIVIDLYFNNTVLVYKSIYLSRVAPHSRTSSQESTEIYQSVQPRLALPIVHDYLQTVTDY